MSRRIPGFTLIEVMGAFVITVVVMLFVIGTFQESGRQQEAAMEKMRVWETAVSLNSRTTSADISGEP